MRIVRENRVNSTTTIRKEQNVVHSKLTIVIPNKVVGYFNSFDCITYMIHRLQVLEYAIFIYIHLVSFTN